MNLFKNNAINYSLIFVISCLTLNFQDNNFYPGLDGSYFWAFNYIPSFIPNDLSKITSIYGPLAFLGYPMCFGNLILFGCLFQILLKFIYGSLLLKLSPFLSVTTKKTILLFLLISFIPFSPEAYLNLIVILFLMLFYFENKLHYLISITFFTGFGYYYKCSAGLSGAILQSAFFIYVSFLNRKIDLKLLFKTALLNIACLLLFGLILFQSFNTILNTFSIYYHNIIMFNETSSSYNGSDNFLWLILCGLSLLVVFFINKDPAFRLFWMLSLLFLYTGYTHSIVRMDNSHYMGFLLCLSLIILTASLFYTKISHYTFLLLALSFYSYYGNLRDKSDYSDFLIAIHNGPKNIYNNIIHHHKSKIKYQKQSKLNLGVGNSLDSVTFSQIKKGSVDFFPWDLMYVEANGLKNWKPRPYLQNLNMSVYFDKKTGDYFASEQSPDHLLWHAGDAFDFFNDIDNSYLLNNEFYSAVSIFSNYYVIHKANNYLLLAHRNRSIKLRTDDFQKEKEVNNKEWIPLPQTDAILGCSVEYDFNLLRGLKKLAYRDDEFFIEYKTANNIKFKKRIWPSDAKEFIWLSPYCRNINDSADYKNITKIRFSNTNKAIHSGKLKIQFKTLKFEVDETKRALYRWFNP
jgi:hypothetical protein